MDKNNLETKRGGIREGAGRRIGSGKFREPTSVVRIPTSQEPFIKDFLAAYQKKRLNTDMDAVSELVRVAQPAACASITAFILFKGVRRVPESCRRTR